MKYIRLVALFFVAILLVLGSLYYYKQPSYTISTDGTLYVVNKGSRSITVFDLFKGQQLEEILLDQEPHEAAIVNNPNRLVVTNYGTVDKAGKSIAVIDMTNYSINKNIDLGESLRPHGIITMPKTNKVAVATDVGNHLSIVNVDTGILEKQVDTKQDFSHLLAHHPVKPLVYVTNINSGSVSVIDVEHDTIVKIIPCGKRVEGIDVTPDGGELWVTNIEQNSICIINMSSYEITRHLKTGKQPLRLKFSVDGKHALVSNAGDGTLSVYDTKIKQQIATIPISGKANLFDKLIYGTPRPVGILMHTNGLYAFVSNYSANRVEVINMKSFKIVSSIKVGEMPDGLAFIE